YKRNHKIKSTEEINEITLKKLADELNLDGFQQAVVKNLITDFSKSAKEINDATTLSPLEKSEKIGKESEKFKTKLFEILNEEQKEKHNKLTNTKDKKKK
nr:hypothetical protein [Flavobacterium sp.]